MMSRLSPVIICLLLLACSDDSSQSLFDQYFEDATLRIDYFHSGDAQQESIEIDQLYRYDLWAGSLTNLIDSLNYGAYYYHVYDATSGELIYSKGFDSYFKEYQTSTPAIEGQVKQFHESAIVPLPKADIEFALHKRNKSGKLEEVYRTAISPIEARMQLPDSDILIYDVQNNGDPHIKADIAIIGDGYTLEEADKFEADLQRFASYFFRAEPCRTSRPNFNIRGVLKPSEDSGIDEPRAGIDRQTAVNSTFNSMGSERYVLTEDNKSLRDIAGHVPYDALYIMINSSRYGGGGIYNFYCTYTSDNIFSDYLMVHEFGHSFFGLADEYYTSSTAYNDFYSPDTEPTEPNITALADPDNIKWKHLLTPGIEIPTPWAKAEYDSLDLIWQTRRAHLNDSIAMLQRSGATSESVAAAKTLYDSLSMARNAQVQAFLDDSPYAGKVGAFEGAGYISEGLYRPAVNCIMFTRSETFCAVCQEAMVRIIETYKN